MHHNKPHKPRHPGFFKKPKPEKKSPARLVAAQSEADPYKDGKLRLFLDDERTCPPGWTLVKNIVELKNALDHCEPDQLRAVSLDWYLGVGVVDGHAAAKMLVDTLLARPENFSDLEAISCHSTNLDEAATMARTIVGAIKNHEVLPWISVQLGLPA